MKHRTWLTIILAATVTAIGVSGQSPDLDLEKALNSIRPDEAYTFCKALSLPEFAGRHTGHEGYTAAAEWAAEKFKSWGLKSLPGEAGYLQPYPSPHVIIDSAGMSLFLQEKDSENPEEIELAAERDFLPLLFSDSGDAKAEVVFAGWGIHAPDLGYDDYAGVDVEGKFVICFRGTPDGRDNRYQPHDHHRHRMQTAKDKGALGLFYIYPEPIANPNGDWIRGFTPAIISEPVADRILKERNITSGELKKDLLAYRKPLSFPLTAKIRFRVDARPYPEATGYNVVGWIEGSDPRLKSSCLVYGAHFDHCGEHMGILFPGADDNASGSAAVLEIAQAFSTLNNPPKRSVVFVLFGGEEMGLQGSTFFAENIPAPFKSADTMFNFDMVGEGDGVGCGISAEPESLQAALKEADAETGILTRTRIMRGVGVRGSDFAPFLNKGIPCISFASNGPHLAYHQSGDTIYRINPDIMADTARLAFLTGYRWANR